MDWVRSNKFLAGFLAVMVIGVAAMGYWLYVEQAAYDQTAQEYNTQVTELKRLQDMSPYPEEGNLKRFADQKKAFAEAVTGLQANLAKMSAPVDKPLSPTDFQNRLREIVSDVLRSATQLGVALPENFYLGFEDYRAKLPDAAAAPQLTSQLAEVERIVRILVNRKVEKISSIKRAPLPSEGGATVTATPGVSTPKAAPEFVTRHAIEIGYTASPNAFRETLVQIVAEPRLFVIRALQVKNQEPKGPVRGQDAAIAGGVGRPAVAPAAAAAPTGGEPLPEKGSPPLRYVVGQEKLDLVMNIELVQVPAPK